MKKLVLVFAMLTGLISFSIAQTPAPAAKPATTKPASAKATTTKPAATATPAAKPAEKPGAANSGVVLKKDGTPDKRYKSAPAATGPVKKDGTPDKRYKANKTN